MRRRGAAQPRPSRFLAREQHVVVRAHLVDERHRHAAARVAEPRLLVVLGLRQQRQRLLDVGPEVGLEPLLLRQDARVLEVAEADVERGEREPGAVRLLDALRQLGLEIGEIACGGQRRRARVEPVGHAEVARGILGQLHQSAHAGLAGRLRVPLRFLVRDGGEQPPLDAARLLGVLEQRPVLRQQRPDAFLQDAGVRPRDLARVCEVALGEAGERAVAARAGEEGVELGGERGEPVRDHPCELARGARREPDVEIEVDVARQRRLVRGDERVARDAVADLRDQRVGRRQDQRFPADLRMGAADRVELVGEAGAVEVGDRGARKVAPGRRADSRRRCR